MSTTQNKGKLYGIIAVATIVVAALLFYMIQQSNINKELRRTTLVISITDMPDTLNPLVATSEASLTLIDPLFDGLTSRSGESVDDFQDVLASEFEADEDTDKHYTIILSDDAVWHDDPNHKLTAEDVIFSYKAIINPENQSPLRGRITKQIRKIEASDSQTIEVYFRDAVPPSTVGNLLTFKIIPATYFGEKMGTDLRNDPVAKKFSRRPIGTGPYKFVRWEGNDISYEIVPQKQDSNAAMSGVENVTRVRSINFTLVHDRQKQAKMLEDGKVDLILDSDPDLHDRLNKKGLKQADYIPHYFYALAMNSTKAPFQSASVRRGISKAIDKTAVVGTVWPDNPAALVNKGVFPHNAESQYQSFRDLNRYNATSAKRLLRSVKGTEITLIYPEAGGDIVARAAGKIVQDLQAAGLTVTAKGLGGAFETQLQNKKFDIALVRYDGFTKGYNVTPLLSSTSAANYTGWGNAKFDKLLAKWQDTGFWIDRLPVAQKLHNELGKQSPYTFLFTLPTRAYYAPRFQEVMLADPSAILGSIESWSIKSE